MLETLILGVIAALLFFKLYSVLGSRTGSEKPRQHPFERPEAPPAPQNRGDNVIPLPDRSAGNRPPMPPPGADLPRSVADGLTEIRRADPRFNENDFLQGARAAFGMIVSAFAAGDLNALRPLLADAVYRNFATAVADRRQKGETLETSIVSFDDVDLAEARMDGAQAVVTVRYTTRQTNVTRAADGQIVEGSTTPEDVVDLWSFSRDTRSSDPNWVLVATRTP